MPDLLFQQISESLLKTRFGSLHFLGNLFICHVGERKRINRGASQAEDTKCNWIIQICSLESSSDPSYIQDAWFRMQEVINMLRKS